MSLLRAAARPMLASYFVVSGFKALRKPDQYVTDAEPVAQRLVPAAQKIAPASIAGKIPEDTTTLVRINGALQLGGGLALATGKGRRVGAAMLAVSLVPSTLARHPFWSRDTAEERAEDRSHFLKNVSLLGGVLLASADTEGKPSIAWRAQAGGDRLTRKGKKAARRATRQAKRKLGGSDSIVDSVAKTGKDLGESLQPLAGAAIASGVGLLGEVEKQTRKTRRRARKQAKKTAANLAAQAREQAKKAQALAQKQAKKAKKEAPKLAKQAQKQAELAAKSAKKKAKKEAPKLAKQAQKQARQAQHSAGKQLDSIRSSAGSTAKDVAASAKDVRKDASKAVQSNAHDAKKAAGKLAENIQLGSN